MSRKLVFVLAAIAAVVIGLVFGVKALTAPGAPAGMPEHISIAQARAAQSGQVVKVGGQVVPGSISWDDASRSLRFILSGDGDQLRVVYREPAPNDFKPATELVVEGTYNAGGIFEATSLTMQTSPLCKACHG